MLGVGVHHPAHHLGVGAEVGSGDVHVRADDGEDFLDVAAGKVLELAFGKLGRVDDDAAFGAAVGEADEGAFPAHPHGEGGDFADGDVLVETDAALGGAGGEVMLDAVALKDGDGAIGALDGNGDGDAAAGVFGAIAHGVGKRDGVGRLVELSTGHAKHVGIVEGRDNDFGHGVGVGGNCNERRVEATGNA